MKFQNVYCRKENQNGVIRVTLYSARYYSALPGASVRKPARDKVMRKEADIRKACSDFRGPSGNS